MRGIGFYFLAYSVHRDVNRAYISEVVVVSPYLLKQILARKSLSEVLRKEQNKVVVLFRHLNWLSAFLDGIVGFVYGQLSHGDYVGVGFLSRHNFSR